MGTLEDSSAAVTWGATGSALSTSDYRKRRITYDESSGKVLMLTHLNNSNEITSFVGTISGSGSTLSISWGSAVQAYPSNSNMEANNTPKYNMAYDSGLGKIIAFFPNTTGTTQVFSKTATISGTSVSWDASQTITWTGGGSNIILYASAVNGRVFLSQDRSSSTYGTIVKTVDVVTNLVHQDHYIGFADQAYSDGQTATIKTYGNNVDTLSGLTAGTKYYIQGDGSLATTADSTLVGYFVANTPIAGTALSATKLLIRDPTVRS